MKPTTFWIILYVIIVNLFGFGSMGLDKYKAKNHEWRISEAMLFFFALIGGSVGSILGMKLFRHKTKHWYFVWGLPVILIIQLCLIGYLIFSPNLSITIM